MIEAAKKYGGWLGMILALLYAFLGENTARDGGGIPQTPRTEVKYETRYVYRDTCLTVNVTGAPVKARKKRKVQIPVQVSARDTVTIVDTLTETLYQLDTFQHLVLLVEVPKVIVMPGPPSTFRQRASKLFATGQIDTNLDWTVGLRLQTKSNIQVGLGYTPNRKEINVNLGLPLFSFGKDQILLK